MKKIAIIGGGIAGLATAFYLREYLREGVDYTLIESAPRLGGKLLSTRQNGLIIEGGLDSFLAQKTVLLGLCRAPGLGDQLTGCNSAGTAA